MEADGDDEAMHADAVRAYYAQFGRREWDRLVTGEGRLEFAITTALLEQHLPCGGRVLDIGGGPGRYAAWLAGRGDVVTLADMSPDLLEIARTELAGSPVRDIVHADARDLTRWDAASFDGALCLGPLYHLTEAEDRSSTLAELRRVVRPDGVVAVALMPRYGFMRRVLATADERAHLTDAGFIRQVMEEGVFVNRIAGRFTHGYGVRSDNPAELLEAAGIETITVASTHGFATGLEDELEHLRALEPGTYQRLIDLLVRTSTDPSLFGTAGHLLCVSRRR